MKCIKVAAAFIKNNSEVIICQRYGFDTFPLMWEFPGGSMEDNETPEDAVKREIKEELGIDIEIISFINTFEDIKGEIKIIVYLFDCRIQKGIPREKECKSLKLINISEIDSFNLAPLDKKIAAYMKK